MSEINKIRVGVVPYQFENNTLHMLFMVPSNPKFGGNYPQIAKGEYENEDSLEKEAIREGIEELGLKENNIINSFLAYESQQKTKKGLNYFYVWAAEIKNIEDFLKPHFETSHTVWLSEKDIKDQLRPHQRITVYNIIRKIKNAKG